MNSTIRNHYLSRFAFATAVISFLLLSTGSASVSPVSAAPLRVPAPTDDFVITVKTDNPGTSYDMQFTIPTTGTGYNYNVDCDNDGTDEITGATGDYICNYGYGGEGTYTVRIKDNSGTGTGFPRIYFNNDYDRLKILTIEQWGTGKWTSMKYAFHGCENLTVGASDTPDLSNVTDMSGMFSRAYAFNSDIGSWDTSNVTSMSGIFRYAYAFNQDIGSWNTTNVTDMNSMFWGASAFNQNISSWNTANVWTMGSMFHEAYDFNQNIGGWDTGSVIDMNYMFTNATDFNQDIGSWDVGLLEHADHLFNGATLSTANYDALLNGWDAQTLKPAVTFDGGNSTYCSGEAARANMIGLDGWTITDGGKDCRPKPKKPSGDISDTTPQYAWTKVDSADLYHFQLYQGSTFVYNQYATVGYCGPTYCGKIPTTALSLNDYQWKIRARIGGIWGDWSDLLPFTVTSDPIPRKPSGDISDTTPKYAWTKAVGATLYHFQLFKGGTFIYNQYATTGYCGPDYCGKTPSTALAADDYTWKVRAKIGGVWEAWSNYLPFTVNP